MDEQIEIYSDLIEKFRNELHIETMNSSSCCLAIFNIHGEVLFLNKAMSNLFKEKSKQSLINPNFDQILKLGHSNSLIFEGVLTIGDQSAINSSINAKIFRKDTSILIIGEVSAMQLLEQNATMHLLNQEINNLQRNLIKEKYLLQTTLNQLNEANKELNELNATKDKFFSIIAHDLKSPFNSILGFSELLSTNVEKYSPERIEQFSGAIYKTAKNTFELLENLLAWSSLQKGKLKPEIKEVNFEEVVKDVAELCGPIAKSKDISLEIDVDMQILVLADSQMLNTIIRNLITNAIKFTYPLGQVKIGTQLLEKEVLIIISDTGIGIDSSKLDKLFSIECDLSVRGTNNEKGTGLGLILCKDFVEIQGGKIWVESELGKGSSFNFTIPLVK